MNSIKSILLSLLLTLTGSLAAQAQKNVYGFKVKDAQGKTFRMKDLRGKAILIVNTASECGYTPQYEGLETLYKQYGSRGLVIVAFPCNQFGGQEPGSDSTIVAFCREKYDVTFPVMSKIEVNGKNAAPLYRYLKEAANEMKGQDIRWNFAKFLISRDGRSVRRFSTKETPADIEPEIREALGLK